MQSNRQPYQSSYRVPPTMHQPPTPPNYYPPRPGPNPQPFMQYGSPYHPSHWQPPQQPQAVTGQMPQTKGLMSYFQDKDGQFDLDKVFNTAGQVANTYQQFTPIIKGISSFIKGAKT
ncbi:YppG family protein [Amphibacillus sediminis]|uniref:YppG family protein n=1 Tax=Amphibacillus sediminis TaxID=360185 RepID=UPI00082A2064|nr:YppG family protein [Amphibacillus sediminis]